MRSNTSFSLTLTNSSQVLMIKRLFRKTLRIVIWTSCFLALTIYCILQIQGVRGIDSAILMITDVDLFLAALVLFLCMITAFIADLFYMSRFE